MTSAVPRATKRTVSSVCLTLPNPDPISGATTSATPMLRPRMYLNHFMATSRCSPSETERDRSGVWPVWGYHVSGLAAAPEPSAKTPSEPGTCPRQAHRSRAALRSQSRGSSRQAANCPTTGNSQQQRDTPWPAQIVGSRSEEKGRRSRARVGDEEVVGSNPAASAERPDRDTGPDSFGRSPREKFSETIL